MAFFYGNWSKFLTGFTLPSCSIKHKSSETYTTRPRLYILSNVVFWKGFILNVYYIQSVRKGAKEEEDIDVWSAIKCSYLDFYPKSINDWWRRKGKRRELRWFQNIEINYIKKPWKYFYFMILISLTIYKTSTYHK